MLHVHESGNHATWSSGRCSHQNQSGEVVSYHMRAWIRNFGTSDQINSKIYSRRLQQYKKLLYFRKENIRDWRHVCAIRGGIKKQPCRRRLRNAKEHNIKSKRQQSFWTVENGHCDFTGNCLKSSWVSLDLGYELAFCWSCTSGEFHHSDLKLEGVYIAFRNLGRNTKEHGQSNPSESDVKKCWSRVIPNKT